MPTYKIIPLKNITILAFIHEVGLINCPPDHRGSPQGKFNQESTVRRRITLRAGESRSDIAFIEGVFDPVDEKSEPLVPDNPTVFGYPERFKDWFDLELIEA